MALVIADRVRETTTTTGTGAVTLAGAYVSYQTFSSTVGNGNSTYYTIASATTGEWEVGIGTYTSAGNSLSRDTVLASSNSGSLVSFSTGSKDVFVTQPSERSLLVNSANNGLFSSGAAFTANGVLYASSSSALTTGSALTFDGSVFATTGAINSNNTSTLAKTDGQSLVVGNQIAAGAKLDVQTASGTAANLRLFQNGVSNFVLSVPASTDALAFLQYGSSELMRLTSTGLGIGTSSPTGRATVTTNGSGGVNVNESTNATSTYGYLTLSHYTNGAFISTVAGSNAGADILRFGTGNTERMRIDSSGNLGIGTTTPAKLLDVNGDALINGLTVGRGTGNVSTNTAVGASALAANTASGNNNTAVGSQSLQLNTAGVENAMFGSVAGYNASGSYNTGLGNQSVRNSSGNHNTGVGWGALTTNTSGGFNVAVGNYSLYSNTTASNNTAVGYQAGYSNTTGAGSVFIGDTAGYSTTGSYNTFVGRQAGYNATTGTYNNFFGNGAGYYVTTGAKNTILGSYTGNQGGLDIRTASNYIVLSDGDGNPRQIIDSSGNLGIGTSSPGYKLDVNGVIHNNNAVFVSQGVQGNASGFTFSGVGTNYGRIYEAANDRWALGYSASYGGASTEVLNWNSSGNVGIGTSSPGAKLHVNGSGIFDTNGTGGSLAIYSYGALVGQIRTPYTGAYNQLAYDVISGGSQIWINGSTEQMHLDSSGNLGLGVTPTTSGYGKGFQFSAAADELMALWAQPINTNDHRFSITNNAKNTGVGTWAYYASNQSATMLEQTAGQFRFFTAPSGTAGNAISFTQAMTLDASGNLGLGTTSPASSSGYSTFSVSGSTGGQIAFMTGGVGKQYIYSSSTDLNFYNSQTGSLIFFTTGSERARIDSDGNLLVGATSGSGKLYVESTSGINIVARNPSASAYSSIRLYNDQNSNIRALEIDYYGSTASGGERAEIATTGAYPLLFLTSNTERARIDSSGNLLVGTTSYLVSSTEKVSVDCGSTNGLTTKTSGGAASWNYFAWNSATSGNNGFIEFGTEGSYTARGSITYNRTLGQVAYNVTSDVRLKDNIADAENAGAKIDALQVRQFDWKETGNHIDYGFIAQELDVVAPSAVSKPEDESKMWSVDYSKLVPMLVKELQSLRARVAQLESKGA